MLAGTYFAFRLYRLEHAAAVGTTVAETEERFGEGYLTVQRVRRGARDLDVKPDLRLAQGDLIVVAARRGVLPAFEAGVGPETDDPDLLAVPLKTISVVITSAEVSGKTIGQLAASRSLARGIYQESLQRGEEIIPREDWTVIERGDIARITGAPVDVDRAARLAGFAGAQTCTPGLNALREASGSNIGALAYTVPYAIGNILLTIWGPLVVGILYALRP
ncbi:MAG TPA: hypothetical protein VLC73_04605 [Burkholderiales bacterium]|nr:hypothetical protein [Burkholderiales bacterium]